MPFLLRIWLIRAIAVLASLAACPSDGHAKAPARVGWAALGQARVVSWSAQGKVAHLRSVNLDSDVELSPGELLLVPVDPGDVLRGTGDVALGLGSGSDDLPDAITWWPAARARDLRVPTWSSARFLAVRTTSRASTRVQLFVARAVSDPFAWYRFDDAVASWLFDGHPISQVPPAQAAAALRQVEALERSLAPLDRTFRAPWLMARWLELSLRLRPLTSPYFARSAVSPSGGTLSAAKPYLDSALEYRELRAGQELLFENKDLDVIRLDIHADKLTGARLAVFEGDTLSRVVELAEQRRGSLPARQPLSVRAVVPVGGGRVRLRLLDGSASVGFEAFTQRTGALDAFALRRSRAHQMLRVRSSQSQGAPEWLRLLGDSDSLATQGACARLSLGKAADAGVHALLSFERARCESSLEATLRATLALRRHFGSLKGAAQASLERALLQRLLDVGASRIDLGFTLSRSGDPEDRAASDALLAALTPNPDPAASERAERASASSADRRDLTQLARRAWLRGTLWAALPPRDPSRTFLTAEQPEADPDTAGFCTVQTGAAPRWTLLDARRNELVVGSSGGTHSHILLRLEPGVERELGLKIGAVPVTVHGAAGLLGHVAIAPGAHRIEVEEGSVILARAPRQGRAPCAELRELERWTLIRPQANFDRRVQDVSRPARLTVHPPSLAGRAHELLIVAGDDRYSAWVRPPATGALEIPSASSSSIEVHAQSPLWVRASVRQPLAPPPEARLASHRPTPSSASEQQLLQRLRLATRKLSAAPGAAERSATHLERAEHLASLGARRLSDLERLRAGSAAIADESREAETSLALRFPEHTPAVVVLGVASQLPPLASAADAAALRRARAKDDSREPPVAVVEALHSASTSSGADALLLANAAERADLPGLAAEAYERIARVTQSGPAFARAATLLADSSRTLADRRLAFRAYLLARRAAELGDPALDAFGRLAPTVSWLSASSAASGNGSLLLAHSGRTAVESLGVRIRRALLDAEPDAILLSDDRRLELHSDQPQPRELGLSLRCMALEQSGTCQASLELDGQKLACPGLDTAASSLETNCQVRLPAGKHRVDITPVPGQGIVMAAVVTSGKELIQPRVVSSWTEVDPVHPLEVRVFGPTVLRITSRVPANQAQRIALELVNGAKSQRRDWEIPANADPLVQRLAKGPGQEPEFGTENEHSWVIEESGEQTLRITPERGHTLLRLYAAFGSGVPRERPLNTAPSTLEPATPSNPGKAPAAPPAIDTDPGEGPLTLNATLNLERTDLNDLEGGRADVHQEFRLSALRELWPSQVYASATLIYRARTGVDSRGALLVGSSSPRGFVPGAFVRGLVMQQQTPSGSATGWHGVAGLLWAVPFSGNAVLVPWLDVTGRRAAAISRVTPDLDSDVYNAYAKRQPVSVTGGLRIDTRPFVDTLARYGILTRYSPRDAVLDRADAVISLDTLPGSSFFPWLTAWGSVSHRPLSALRSSAFTRTTLGAQLNFFGWLRGSERWILFGRVVHFIDWPVAASTLSFALGLSVDETFGRGLRDYAPRNVPFRGRLEQGSARVARRGPAREPAWEVAP